MSSSITHYLKKSELIESNYELKKNQVFPGIQTQAAQTECHSTTCATTTPFWARMLACCAFCHAKIMF